MQPQLTTRRHGVWWLVPTSLGGLLLLLVWCHGVLAEAAPSSLFPLPDALRPNVTFWKRVFAVFDRNGGCSTIWRMSPLCITSGITTCQVMHHCGKR